MEKEKGLESKLLVIKYIFTTKELAVHSSNIVERIAEREALLKKKADFVKEMGGEISSLESEIKKLASESRDGFKHCSHPCYEVFDFDTKQVEIHREDTDEMVDIRTMEIDEYQRDMFNPTETMTETDAENSDLPEAVQMAIRMKKVHPAEVSQACIDVRVKRDPAVLSDKEAISVCELIKDILDSEDNIPDENPENIK